MTSHPCTLYTPASGEEFAVAMREARRLNVTVALIDRDVQVTLNRLYEALSQSDLR